eukprot:CAMPEP_0172721608 /NCGR_PEP_ID=MMETSP1074-20121228/79481_1 /TAXON_ID=2916 /ORGANISM="Ceratium fusus, Strain PA161109" /LENGTH=152 /DNA_ID=CAMNT_0013547381 /DNA_START=84 /DNA_END=542 /DNA_ORIENTATION=-
MECEKHVLCQPPVEEAALPRSTPAHAHLSAMSGHGKPSRLTSMSLTFCHPRNGAKATQRTSAHNGGGWRVGANGTDEERSWDSHPVLGQVLKADNVAAPQQHLMRLAHMGGVLRQSGSLPGPLETVDQEGQSESVLYWLATPTDAPSSSQSG